MPRYIAVTLDVMMHPQDEHGCQYCFLVAKQIVRSIAHGVGLVCVHDKKPVKTCSFRAQLFSLQCSAFVQPCRAREHALLASSSWRTSAGRSAAPVVPLPYLAASEIARASASSRRRLSGVASAGAVAAAAAKGSCSFHCGISVLLHPLFNLLPACAGCASRCPKRKAGR